jgi:two-component system chemotaxis response regulator CheY
MQVLVVDDSPVMRHYISRTLHMTGIEVEVHEAENGRDALEKMFALHPDLVITDLNMPEMSGQELIARMQESKDMKLTPVIVMSALRSPGISDELMHAGVVAFMTKPVSPEALRRRLLSIQESNL